MSATTRSAGKLIYSGSAAVGLAIALAVGSSAAIAAGPPLVIESTGARAFAGKTLPNPTDPTDFLACDHGYADWDIPVGARNHPVVFTHGSGTRGYETTFDGQPGFQTIFLRQRYPVYLVDLPRTGRAGLGCVEIPYDPNSPFFSARFVFNNRVGVWEPNTPFSEKEFFPGVAFSQDPEAMNQYLRVQYPEFNTPENEELESDALAIFADELTAERGKPIIFTHSSGGSRGWLAATKTDNIGAIISFEPANMMFPEGEEPGPALRADGEMVPYTGRVVPLETFRKLTTVPILIVWGDFIPWTMDPANVGARLGLDNRRIGRERFIAFAEAINRHGGNATNLFLPEVGVHGNTHYPYADTNAPEVADQILKWIRQQGLDGRGGN